MGRLFDFDFSMHLFLFFENFSFFIRDRRKTVELSALLIEKRFKGLKDIPSAYRLNSGKSREKTI